MPSGILYAADPLAMLASPTFQRTIQVQFLLLALVLFVAWLARGAEFPSLKGRRSPARPIEKTEVCAEVAALYIYPIKSCAGTELKEASIGRKGWELDRRWMVWRIGKGKLSLREEPKLTLIVPTIDKAANQLRLSLSPKAAVKQESIAVPLYPTESELATWEKIGVEMYGDGAHGRVVQSAGKTGAVGEWLSRFLGYEVVLLQFDPRGEQRAAFPLLRPPADLERWEAGKRKQLEAPQGIEFQDEYPFLVSTQESLDAVRAQLIAAAAGASSSPPSDGAGGQAIRNLDASKWSIDGGKLSMQRFRPNIVLRAREGSTYNPFSEDDWDSLWFAPSASLSEQGEVQEVKSKATASLSLVARCQRCLLTTVDPETAERDVLVPLALLRRSRLKHKHAKRPGPCFGMYAIPLLLGDEQSEKGLFGSINVGDAVAVRWRPPGEDVETR